MPIAIDRRQVLAGRVEAQQFNRRVTRPADLAVLDLGVQDSPAGAAVQALAARLPPGTELGGQALFAGSRPLALVWSHRGAPHLHRGDELAALAAAIWPWSDADAKARLGRAAARLVDAGLRPLEGLGLAAEAWAATVSGASAGLTKGQASTEVSRLMPDEVPEWCRGCQATHLNDLLFRLGALPGGARLVPGAAPLSFEPIAGWPGVPQGPAGTDRLLSSYLRLLGPATRTEAAGFLGTSGQAVIEAWPEGLVEVTVEGRGQWMAPPDLDALLDAPDPELIRLVAASDPYLQTRDRDLLVPDRFHQKALWRILGSPGALLVDGEVAGIWRAKQTRGGHGSAPTLAVTLEPFGRLASATRRAAEDEAVILASLRGLEAAEVRVL